MEYKINRLKNSEIELVVTFSHDEIKERLPQAASQISEHIEIKGFRAGKAPLEKVIEKVGAVKVYEQAGEYLARKSYTEILTKEKIEPLTQPKIDFEKVAPDNDFVYKATLTTIPSVEVGDIKSIKVKDVNVNISEKEVNKVIEDLKEYSASEVLEDKPAELGDKVEVDFEGFKDNVPFDGGKASNYALILGKGQMIPGFEEGIVGMKKDEEKEIKLKFPKEYHVKSLAGQPVDFKIKLNAIYKRTLPKEDDTFAKLHGKETFEELKKAVKTNLENEETTKQNQRIELEIIEQLIKKSTFGELPDVLVNQELDKMLNELKQNLMQQGLKFEDYLLQLKKSEPELRIDLSPQAVDRVKASLLTRSIYTQNNMVVSDDELDEEIKKYRKMYEANPQMKEMLEKEEYKEMIRNVIGNSKVMAFLKNEVTLEK